jgi:hypothetical protein
VHCAMRNYTSDFIGLDVSDKSSRGFLHDFRVGSHGCYKRNVGSQGILFGNQVMFRISIAAASLFLTALPAAAQSGAPDTEGGRYSFNRVDDGYLRLDQQTGQVSLCNRRSVGWACYPVPDERSALEEEIARLQKDNVAMKKEMLARGIVLPGMKQSQAQTEGKPDLGLKVPSDAELDRVMGAMEKMWRRLVEMVQRVQKELASPI